MALPPIFKLKAIPDCIPEGIVEICATIKDLKGCRDVVFHFTYLAFALYKALMDLGE